MDGLLIRGGHVVDGSGVAGRDVRTRIRDEITRCGLTNLGRIPSGDVVRAAAIR